MKAVVPGAGDWLASGVGGWHTAGSGVLNCGLWALAESRPNLSRLCCDSSGAVKTNGSANCSLKMKLSVASMDL